jgi:hypothetical protein
VIASIVPVDSDLASSADSPACARSSGCVGHHRPQDDRVEGEDGARDRGHACGHHDEELAAAHRRQIGPDHHRRLDHSDEDVGRRRQADRAAHAHRLAQQPREGPHDPLQHAPVVEQARERPDDEHERQRPEGQHEARARSRLRIGQRRAAQEPEDEGGAGAGRAVERRDRVVDRDEERLRARHLEQQRRQRELQQHPRGDDAPRDDRATLGEHPGNEAEREYAE